MTDRQPSMHFNGGNAVGDDDFTHEPHRNNLKNVTANPTRRRSVNTPEL